MDNDLRKSIEQAIKKLKELGQYASADRLAFAIHSLQPQEAEPDERYIIVAPEKHGPGDQFVEIEDSAGKSVRVPSKFIDGGRYRKIGPLYTQSSKTQEIGEVVVTTSPQTGQVVAVTRQDAEGRILSVIWEAEPLDPQKLGDKIASDLMNMTTDLCGKKARRIQFMVGSSGYENSCGGLAEKPLAEFIAERIGQTTGESQ